jgi:hypothetical protein
MTPRLRIAAVLALVASLAASTSPASAAPAKSRSATTTHAASPPRTARAAGTATKPRAAEPSRTLQDIHIEGEIPVPQVLFITARDQRRFMDLQHRRYLRTSQEVGEQTVFPSWIALIRNHPAVERKETPR